jgi:hypothetical protein
MIPKPALNYKNLKSFLQILPLIPPKSKLSGFKIPKSRDFFQDNQGQPSAEKAPALLKQHRQLILHIFGDELSISPEEIKVSGGC